MSIISKLGSFYDAMVVQIAAGFPIVDKDTAEKRAEICSSCEYLKDDSICGQCGCFLKIKIPLGTSECPIKKW
jgi:hypothetical protein